MARHISDLSDPDANYFALLGGQDGWFGSPNFIDQVALWQRGEYVALPMLPASAAKNFRHRTDQRIRIPDGQAGQQLKHLQIRHDRAEDRFVLHLSGHDRLIHTFRLESLDQFAELAERHPVHLRCMLLDFRKCFLLDGGNDHVDSLAARRLEHEEGELSIAGDEAVFT